MKSIFKATTDYMAEGIKYACQNFKNRSAGSAAELNCQRYFKGELSKWADQVEEEPFSLHPKAFMGWMPIAGVMDLISVVMFWLCLKTGSLLFPIIGTITILISVSLDSLEFIFYREFIDFLFPKAISTNVMARRAPKGEVKRRIIFGGHADAPYEMTYSLYGRTLIPVTAGSTIGMLFVCLCNVGLLIQTLIAGKVAVVGLWKILGFIEIAFIPFFIAIIFFTNWNRVVDGANDNLSGCFVSMGVLKYMAEEDFRFEHTEVCCLITGGEESGLRGALAYAKRHKEELLHSNVETIFIALDTMREIEQLQIYTEGQSGTQKNSKAVGQLLKEAGKNCGEALRKATVYPGATDAEGFSRNGILSCGFCGVNHDPQLYYHTRHDTWENISKDCLQVSLQICMEAAYLFEDNEGIAQYQCDKSNSHFALRLKEKSAITQLS